MTTIPKGAETVETPDGRVFFSADRWLTVHLVEPGKNARRIGGRQADLARFLAVVQSTGGPA